MHFAQSWQRGATFAHGVIPAKAGIRPSLEVSLHFVLDRAAYLSEGFLRWFGQIPAFAGMTTQGSCGVRA